MAAERPAAPPLAEAPELPQLTPERQQQLEAEVAELQRLFQPRPAREPAPPAPREVRERAAPSGPAAAAAAPGAAPAGGGAAAAPPSTGQAGDGAEPLISRADFEARFAPQAMLALAARTDGGFVQLLVGRVQEAAVLFGAERSPMQLELMRALSAAFEWFAGSQRCVDAQQTALGAAPEVWLAGGSDWLRGLREGLCSVLAARAVGRGPARGAIALAALAVEAVGQAALWGVVDKDESCLTVCLAAARVELHVCLSEALRKGAADEETTRSAVAAARFLELAVCFLCDEDGSLPAPGDCRWSALPGAAIGAATKQLTEAYSDLLHYYAERGAALATDIDAACFPLLQSLMGDFGEAVCAQDAARVRELFAERGVEL